MLDNVGPFDTDDDPDRLDGFFRDGDGSFYWWMTVVLPGFRQFRFPAKLFTFTALGLAALAGMGWDDLLARRAGRDRHSVHLLSGIEPRRARRSLDRPARHPDRFRAAAIASNFGPFDADGGFRALVRSLAQAVDRVGAGPGGRLQGPDAPAVGRLVSPCCW